MFSKVLFRESSASCLPTIMGGKTGKKFLLPPSLPRKWSHSLPTFVRMTVLPSKAEDGIMVELLH